MFGICWNDVRRVFHAVGVSIQFIMWAFHSQFWPHSVCASLCLSVACRKFIGSYGASLTSWHWRRCRSWCSRWTSSTLIRRSGWKAASTSSLRRSTSSVITYVTLAASSIVLNVSLCSCKLVTAILFFLPHSVMSFKLLHCCHCLSAVCTTSAWLICLKAVVSEKNLHCIHLFLFIIFIVMYVQICDTSVHTEQSKETVQTRLKAYIAGL